jgi:hypothetical protein
VEILFLFIRKDCSVKRDTISENANMSVPKKRYLLLVCFIIYRWKYVFEPKNFDKSFGIIRGPLFISPYCPKLVFIKSFSDSIPSSENDRVLCNSHFSVDSVLGVLQKSFDISHHRIEKLSFMKQHSVPVA